MSLVYGQNYRVDSRALFLDLKGRADKITKEMVHFIHSFLLQRFWRESTFSLFTAEPVLPPRSGGAVKEDPSGARLYPGEDRPLWCGISPRR